MGNDFINVDSNITVTNYKPVEGRKASKSDIKITNNENGNIEVPGNWKPLFDVVRNLDGKPELSWNDGLMARSLKGSNGIADVKMDPNAKVVTFVMNDRSCVRIDMGIDDNPAIQSIKNEINKGNAEYVDGIMNRIIQYFTPHTPLKGAEIVLNSLPSGCKTLGDVKQKFHLPDNCLRNNIPQGGGDFDTYKAEVPLYIHVATLAKGLGVSVEQIESLFNRK